MRSIVMTIAGVALVLVLTLPGHAQGHAVQWAVTPAGVPYLVGGSDRPERDELDALHTRYSVWLVTRDRESGDALGGVHLRIIDSTHHSVFDSRLDAPSLLIDLPAGRYQVEARYLGRLQRWAVASHPGDAVPRSIYCSVLG